MEGGDCLARGVIEQASKGKNPDAEFVGQNEDRRCCAVGEDVGQKTQIEKEIVPMQFYLVLFSTLYWYICIL